MRIDFATRAKAGVALIVSSALALSWQILPGIRSNAPVIAKYLINRGAPYGGNEIGLEDYEKRYEELKESLPPDAVVGYFSDLMEDEGKAEDQSAYEYYATQYVLVPIMVVEATNLPLVIGNFHDRVPTRESLVDMRLELLKDFGKGVMLFRGQVK